MTRSGLGGLERDWKPNFTVTCLYPQAILFVTDSIEEESLASMR